MSLSFISASQLNSLLPRKFSSEQMIFGALIAQSVISITLLIASMNDPLGLYQTIGMLFIFWSVLVSTPYCQRQKNVDTDNFLSRSMST
jgi:DHA1 family bicyclomycin/chloramphenicol resistance-like MFS transporter